MKRFWCVVSEVMPPEARLRTARALLSMILCALAAVVLFAVAAFLPSYHPRWLIAACLILAVVFMAAFIAELISWHRKTYVPALEVYFYDREAWDNP